MDFGTLIKTASEDGRPVRLKSALVGGVSAFALTAALSFSHLAYAADAEITGTVAAPNALQGTIDAATDDITDAAATNSAGDAASLDIEIASDAAITNIDIDAPADGNVSTLAIIDSNNGDDDTLAISGFIDITTGKTFTIVVGGTEADGTGTASASRIAITVAGDIADGGTNATQGGNLTFLGATNEAGDGGANTFAANGDINLTGLTVQGGAGGAAIGQAVTFTAGNASADTIAVDTIAVTGGAGGATAGGASILTVTGTLSDPSGGVTVTGGAGSTAAGGAATMTVTENVAALTGAVIVQSGASAGAVGGDSTLTFTGTTNTATTSNLSVLGGNSGGTANAGAALLTLNGASTTTGTVTVTGGTGGASTGDGGSATLDTNGAFSGGAVTVTGGVGSTGGAAGVGGAAAIDAESTFTSSGTLSLLGGNAGAGGAASNGGAVTADFNDQTVTVDALTITGGDGAATNASVGGAVTVTNAGNLTSTGAVTITGGNAGTAAGNSSGGAVTVALDGTGTHTVGSMAITGGNGSTNDSADGGAAAVTALGAVTSAGALTITGGDGDSASNGDGGNASADFALAVTFSAITLDDGTAGTATAGTATIDFSSTAAQAVSGTIDGAAAGEGTLTVTGGAFATTFGDNIGGTNSLLALNHVSTGAGSAVFNGTVAATTITIDSTSAVQTTDFNGDVTATNINITDGAGTNIATVTAAGDVTAAIAITDAAGGEDVVLTFDGAVAQTVTGAITAAADDAGTINVNQATAVGTTFVDTIGTTTNDVAIFQVAAAAKATLTEAVFAETLTLSGHTQFNQNGNEADQAITLPATATFEVLNGVVAGETLITAGAAVTVAGGAESVTLLMPANFTSGTITLLSTNQVDAGADAFLETDTGLVDLTVSLSGADVVVTASKRSIAGIASTLSISEDDAKALDNGAQAADGDEAALDAISTALNAGGAAATLAGQQIGVQADTLGASSSAAITSGTQSFAATSARLASLRTGNAFASAATGFSAGSGPMSNAFWLKPFANKSEQDERGGIDGFEAYTQGFAAGVDTPISDTTRIGISMSYAGTEVDGEGAGDSNLDIGSYQVNAYTDHVLAGGSYLEALLGYATNQTDTTRALTFGGLNRTAEGSFDSAQWMAGVRLGKASQIGDGLYLTPEVGLSYMRLSSDTYTETGAGDLNLIVNPDDTDRATAALSAKLHKVVGNGMVFELGAGLGYDFVSDDAQTTATYTGGGGSFTTTGLETDELSGNLRLGLSIDGDTWSLGASYDLESRSDFLGQSGSLEAKFSF